MDQMKTIPVSETGYYPKNQRPNITTTTGKETKRIPAKQPTSTPVIPASIQTNILKLINVEISKVVKTLQDNTKINYSKGGHETAKEIITLLNKAKTTIFSEIKNVLTDKSNTESSLYLEKSSTSGKYEVKDNKFDGKTFIKGTEDELIEARTILSLDSDIPTVDENGAAIDIKNLNIKMPSHLNALYNRLEKCTLFERNYLVKHEELMTTFAFTVNLYDSFVYAITIILFLLKNLEPYTKSGDGTNTTRYGNSTETIKTINSKGEPCDMPIIELPDPLIKRIDILQEQSRFMKDSIMKMDASVKENKLSKIIEHKIPSAKPESNLVKNIYKQLYNTPNTP